MSVIRKVMIVQCVMFFLGVLCFADAESEALKVFTEYRKVRSLEQALYLDVAMEELLITEKMKQFSYDGISTMIFHTYNPTICIVEDDYKVVDFTDAGSDNSLGKEIHDYFLKVEETIIGKFDDTKIEKNDETKKNDTMWMIETDDKFYIYGDSSLEYPCIRETDFTNLFGSQD